MSTNLAIALMLCFVVGRASAQAAESGQPHATPHQDND
jgi:hypothetical protein